MGVGLNSGTVMAGNVGSEQRVEYTALGDTTNTASRLEGMTKDSEAHALHLRLHPRAPATPSRRSSTLVGEVEIRGRAREARACGRSARDGPGAAAQQATAATGARPGPRERTGGHAR